MDSMIYGQVILGLVVQEMFVKICEGSDRKTEFSQMNTS